VGLRPSALVNSRVRSVPYKWLVAVVFVVGLFMDMLDMTVVNVALPALGVVFDARNTTLEWVITAYLLSLAVWIPASGWLGDRFGTKRIFLLALAIFTIGSACCGLAQSMEALIAFRVVQGIGGGMLTPVGMAMVYRAFPQEERARAAGVLAIPIVLAPTIGPVVGGFLVDHASWRWIFYVNLPIGLLAFVFAAFALEEHVEARPGRFDLAGFVLSGTGLPLLLYALSQAPERGWTSARVILGGFGGIALLLALLVVELRVEEPLLDLRLFGERMFRAGNVAYFVYAAGVLGVLFLLPLFLQQLRGISALQTGLVTFTQAIGLVIAVRPASRLYDRIGPRRMVALGMIGTAVTTALMLGIGLDTNLWWLRGILFIRGIALAMAIIPLQAATYAQVSSEDTGRASALFNANRQVSASVAIAVLATVLTTAATRHVAEGLKSATTPALQARAIAEGTLTGYRDAYLVAVAIALLGLACAWLIHDEDAVGVTGHGGFE
jgi:EmrB/QacA subfamily drug resistance transporter